jgi:hypothetical protein
MEKFVAFPITSVCRGDLESIGFDTTLVDDGTMTDLAGKLADDYCDQLFWGSLEIIADYLEIPKRLSDSSLSN